MARETYKRIEVLLNSMDPSEVEKIEEFVTELIRLRRNENLMRVRRNEDVCKILAERFTEFFKTTLILTYILICNLIYIPN